MKKIFLGMAVVTMLATACNNDNKQSDTSDSSTYNSEEGTTTVADPVVKEGEYVNLTSGEKVNIVKDPATGIAIDSKTQIPVQFYYDPVTLDTMYQSGMVVNNLLIKEGKGKYKLDDMKIKVDGDKIKIKTDSSKLKVDGEDGKIKTDDTKIKVEDGEMKVKPN